MRIKKFNESINKKDSPFNRYAQISLLILDGVFK